MRCKQRIGIRLGLATFAAAMLLPPMPAKAAVTSATVTVTANVESVCTVSRLTDLNFGPVLANLGSPLAATATIEAACTQGATVSIEINNGLHFGLGQSATLRSMANSTGGYISYHIYQPDAATLSSCAGASVEWTTGANALSGTIGAGGRRSISLCGVIDAAPPGGYAAGAFSDVVTVTAIY
ncbi:Csu type fimbrial protein [Roseateles violae]|uniref:Spore coat protein U domain-containing protein n=1 Tax=Roseateles violae TaxID=3058042 RepID=A0ABT8DNI3_9BURK|nr:spore coat protein U domain-containing protein [Pelomonas sp. PFR6]MDN3919702.1 spore coat protein U domain-containing protein [Pelomonas sp. PFR6]